MNAKPNGNGRVSWATLISTGSLVFAIVGGGWALVKNEIGTVKELNASDRDVIHRQLADNDRAIEMLRENKLDARRFDQALAQLIKQIDALNDRVTRLEHRGK